MQFQNQLVGASEIFRKEKNWPPLQMLTLTMCLKLDEQLKVDRKVLDVVDRFNKKCA